MEVSEIRDASDADFRFPDSLSFFAPYLQYHIREVLGVGGEAYVSRTSEGAVSGAFVYDGFERGGTVYTRSGRSSTTFTGWNRSASSSLRWQPSKKARSTTSTP